MINTFAYHDNSIARSLSVLANASNENRSNKIPKLTEGNKSSKEVYLELHKTYFQDEFYGRVVTDNYKSREHIFIQSMNDNTPIKGRLRETNVSINSDIQFPDWEDLEKIANIFFNVLDETPKIKNQEEFIKFITLVDMVLRLCHFPKDGSGRTNEDFLVYLGQKHGYPLTFSKNSFRGFIDDDLVRKRELIRSDLGNGLAKTYERNAKFLSNLIINELAKRNYSYSSPDGDINKFMEKSGNIFQEALQTKYIVVNPQETKRIAYILAKINSHAKQLTMEALHIQWYVDPYYKTNEAIIIKKYKKWILSIIKNTSSAHTP